jgi:hypothetical protein
VIEVNHRVIPNRILKGLAILGFSITAVIAVIFITEAVLLFRWSRRAESLLSVMRTLHIGKSTASDAVRMTDNVSELRELYNYPYSEGGAPPQLVTRGQCDIDCGVYLVAPVPPVALGRLLGYDMFSYWDRNHWLADLFPIKALLAHISVHDGVVQEMEVDLRSFHGDGVMSYAQVIISDSSAGLPWIAERTSGHFEWASSARMLRVRVTTHARPEQLAHAMDFNSSCLFPRFHCSDCDMLPGACQEH